MLRQAITARSLTGARNIARVLDSRVRRLTGHRPPAGQRTRTSRVPVTGSPDLNRYLTELAQAMDDRARRIGEHAAATRPAWAIHALGDLPADLARQAGWQERAARIGAYRELYGHDSQADPIGPAPALTSPEAWADWHTASTALHKVSGIDLRDVPDNRLRLRRAGYERELAWAPPNVAEELRLARLQARTAWENATRASHGADAATDPAITARQQNLATIWHAMHTRAASLAEELAAAQETRRQWAALTEPTRHMALAADVGLRHRHPEAKLTPITGTAKAGPASADRTDAHAWVRQVIAADPATPSTLSELPTSASKPKKDVAARHASLRQQLDMSDTVISGDAAEHLARVLDNARRAQEQIDYLRGQPEYADLDNTIYLGPAWNIQACHQRDAIIQPPKPDIVPASAILRSPAKTAETEAEPEAGGGLNRSKQFRPGRSRFPEALAPQILPLVS